MADFAFASKHEDATGYQSDKVFRAVFPLKRNEEK